MMQKEYKISLYCHDLDVCVKTSNEYVLPEDLSGNVIEHIADRMSEGSLIGASVIKENVEGKCIDLYVKWQPVLISTDYRIESIMDYINNIDVENALNHLKMSVARFTQLCESLLIRYALVGTDNKIEFLSLEQIETDEGASDKIFHIDTETGPYGQIVDGFLMNVQYKDSKLTVEVYDPSVCQPVYCNVFNFGISTLIELVERVRFVTTPR